MRNPNWLYLGQGRHVDMACVVRVKYAKADVDDEIEARVFLYGFNNALIGYFCQSDPAYSVIKAWHKPEYHWVKDGDLPDFYRLCWLGYAEYGGVREYVTVGKFCLISTVDWADAMGEKMPTPDWWVDLGEPVPWPISKPDVEYVGESWQTL